MPKMSYTPAYFNALQADTLPGVLGVEILDVDSGAVKARMMVTPQHLAPNGFLHAASVVMLADTCCGYGSIANLPQGAQGFTTIELKSNHLGTARDGAVLCVASPAHLGRTTQVWDAIITAANCKTIALFRCTQMILWPKG